MTVPAYMELLWNLLRRRLTLKVQWGLCTSGLYLKVQKTPHSLTLNHVQTQRDLYMRARDGSGGLLVDSSAALGGC